ncbi:TPA: GTPase [Campylobacter jejuni]
MLWTSLKDSLSAIKSENDTADNSKIDFNEEIKKYNLFEEYNDFLYHVEKLQKDITVSAIGLYNSGKSSLLNALTNAFNEPNFSVADVVETKEIKSVNFENMIFLDTPGLNADLKDDKNAFLGMVQSDIYLFVHNVSTGELTKTEVDYIKKMIEKNKVGFSKNFIFVLSRIDGIDEKELKSVKNVIKKQFETFFDEDINHITFVEISANSYIKGNKENKKLLIESSKIENLKKILRDKNNALKKHIKDLRLKQIKKHEFFTKIHALLQSKKSEVERLQKQKEEMRQTIDNEIKKANEAIKALYEL